ncbi:MAG: hypothetical protein J6J01_10550 [Oscillospiraceae bacterium]|nr:hypothetical protein [Oscillospiraceae bacterium]
MKKLIVVIMALITIFSASVSVFAATYVDWEIVDYFTNLSYSNYNCSLVFKNTAKPTPNMSNLSGVIGTQKTTYNVLLAMYETVSVEGASFQANAALGGVFEWYEYGDYCWIKYDLDNSAHTMWVGNYQGKILYCDAPTSETTYTISAIAGATGYCLTNRPAGTTGNGYLGDLLVTQDNLTTIHGVVDGLGGVADYYMVLRIVNGEYRYYIMCTYPNRQQYFVCNTSGQLFYALRDEVTDDGGDTGGGGSTFDPTEVITAINSVYSAINSMNTNLGTRLANILNATNGIGVSVENLAANVVTGFTGIQEQLSTLNSYFTDLSGLFPVQETITLLGSDTRVAWDSADRITNVTTAGFNGDLIVKERPGDLVDESGYEKVTINETEYSLYNDNNGYRRIKANNAYPDTGPAIPENSIFYFPFENSLSSSVGDYTLTANGSYSYADGVDGKAVKFDSGTTKLNYSGTGNFGNSVSSCTFGFWLYIPDVSSSSFYYTFNCGLGSQQAIVASIFRSNRVEYSIKTADNSKVLIGGNVVANGWNYISFTAQDNKLYLFTNGNLDNIYTWPSTFTIAPSMFLQLGGSGFESIPVGSMVDNFMYVSGDALWTSSFDPYEDAIFSEVAADYFLPCTDQTIGLVFDDTINKTLSPTDVNGNAIIMGRLEDDFSEIYMDISTMMWYCHDPQTQTEILLSSANQQIMNDTIYVRQNYTMLPADQITADALQNLLPVDSPVYLDMPEGAKLTITYDHYTGWFRMMYILMDKQTKLLSDLDIVNETIINVENTVIDITNSNPAYNVFYITKTDGTTESVGDAAKDAAVFVGDILSMFYRLVFDDALDNVGILKDFEGAYSNTEVSVW